MFGYTLGNARLLGRQPSLPQHERPGASIHVRDSGHVRGTIHEVVDLSDDETDNDNGNEILDFVDLCDLEDETEETLQEIPVPAPVPTHSTQDVLKYNIIEAPWVEIEVVELGRFQLRPGKSVELLGGDEGKPNTSFLLIKNIIRNNETQEIHLCGFSLRRNSNFGCFSPPRLNEVYLDLEENMNDCRHTYEQGIIRIPLGHVKKIRRITFTHKGVAEEPGFRKDVVLRKSQPDYEARKEFVKENEQLVCRYLIIRRYATMVEWKKQRTTETVLRRLYEDEHPLRPISEWKLKVCTPTHQQEDRIVTYGSGFCGCGGDTTGARQAGLAVKYAFDMDKRSCITFEHNHSDAICFNEEAFDMCMADDGLIPYAHIVHLSVPCKPWSPAHTRDGKDDGANIAALFATGPFLRKTKPMFHTQEQTAGLVTHHPVEFAALIRIILDEGYNVRWGRHQFVDFGLSSRRNRLIIFAAQIGLPLPKFPRKTHGPEAQLQWLSIHDVISRIPEDADWHLETAKRFDHPKQLYDSRKQWASCITCGSNTKTLYHPSGSRQFTIREIAALMGFPESFKFPDEKEVPKTAVRTQLGNAVPPKVWEKFMAMIKETKLHWDDGKINEAGMPVTAPLKRKVCNASFDESQDVQVVRTRLQAVDLTGDD